MTKIAISYRRDDSIDITGRIFDRLTSRYGRDAVFRDIDSIPPGRDFREHIQDSLAGSDVLMVVVGPRWFGDERRAKARIYSDTDYVRTELEIALARGIPMIPLLVGGTDMPEPSELPESIREFAYRNAMHIDSGRDFDHHMDGLIRSTEAMLGGGTTSRAVEARLPVAGTPPVAPRSTHPAEGKLVLQVLGGAIVVFGLIHSAWFGTNLLAAMDAGLVRQMSRDVWSYPDLIFGIGGLVVGFGTLTGGSWARVGGMILCMLILFGNFFWFVEHFDKDLPRLVYIATACSLPLAALGLYMYALRWPPSASGGQA